MCQAKQSKTTNNNNEKKKTISNFLVMTFHSILITLSTLEPGILIFDKKHFLILKRKMHFALALPKCNCFYCDCISGRLIIAAAARNESERTCNAFVLSMRSLCTRATVFQSLAHCDRRRYILTTNKKWRMQKRVNIYEKKKKYVLQWANETMNDVRYHKRA